MTASDGRRTLGQRFSEWVRRYAPLEIVSTLTALAGAGIAELLTTNAVAVAYAGAWAENVGYYSYAFAREMEWIGRSRAEVGSRPGVKRAPGALKALLWEFGVAEVLDSFVIRPACMYAAIALTGTLGVGIVAGKIAADIAFYAIAIVFYELGRKRRGYDA